MTGFGLSPRMIPSVVLMMYTTLAMRHESVEKFQVIYYLKC